MTTIDTSNASGVIDQAAAAQMAATQQLNTTQEINQQNDFTADNINAMLRELDTQAASQDFR